jgi:hypothetical protein
MVDSVIARMRDMVDNDPMWTVSVKKEDARALLALVEACVAFSDTIRDSDDPNEVAAQLIAALQRVTEGA